MAVLWYRKAAEQGSAEGEYSVGAMYASGRKSCQSLIVTPRFGPTTYTRTGATSGFAATAYWQAAAAFTPGARGAVLVSPLYGELVALEVHSAVRLRSHTVADLHAHRFGLETCYGRRLSAHVHIQEPHEEVWRQCAHVFPPREMLGSTGTAPSFRVPCAEEGHRR